MGRDGTDSTGGTEGGMGGAYEISSDKSRLDVSVVHGYLTRSYWSPGIPLEMVRRGIEGSLCWGVYERSSGGQVGFARVVSDCASFAYLCDVFVLEGHRGRGLSKRLVESILAEPRLQGLRRFCLLTRDAQELYSRYGFKNLEEPGRYMEINRRSPWVEGAGSR